MFDVADVAVNCSYRIVSIFLTKSYKHTIWDLNQHGKTELLFNIIYSLIFSRCDHGEISSERRCQKNR